MDKKLKEHIIYKCSSARFITTIVITFSYCALMFMAFRAVCDGILEKDFFMGLFAGFSAMVGSITTFYYTRSDRK